MKLWDLGRALRGPRHGRLRNQLALERAVCASIEQLEGRFLLTATVPTPTHQAILAALPSRQHGQFTAAGLQLSIAPQPRTYVPSFVLLDRHPGIDSRGGLTPFSTSAPTGFTPTTVRHAYGIDQLMFGAITGNGSGQTIAILDVYDYPTAAADLHAFDQATGLPDPPSFTKVNQDGGSTLPGVDPAAKGQDWEVESALDIEWAHAMAPGASIVLVEANTPSDSDLIQHAANWARNAPGVSVVSMSFGRDESASDTSLNSSFSTPAGHAGVTFLASTGDAGAPGGFPAYSPNVVAVGGTKLSVDSSGNYVSETGWSGSGGGISAYESQPAYQNGVVTQSATMRTIPDVAFNADPASGVAIYDSYDYGTAFPWVSVGGTSLSAPCWAGLVAVANQGRSMGGAGPLDGFSQALPHLYGLPANAFHDVTSGNNGNAAGAGYDLVTGRGSPVANTLVPRLAASGPFVISTAPTGVLSTPASSLDFNFSTAMDPTSFSLPGDLDSFTGPGGVDLSGQIIGFAWVNGNTTLRVSFASQTAEGGYAMTIGPQILSSSGTPMDQNQNGVAGETPADDYIGTFRYDALPMQVISTSPANGSVVTLPFTTLDVQFSEPYDPATVKANNLTLSQGTVTGAQVLDATTVRYTLSGITTEGAFTVSLAAGALNDADGNPMLAYSETFTADLGVVPLPPTAPKLPAGSLVYDTSVSATLSPAGDVDSFTIAVDAGQTIAALIHPTSGTLAPTITLLDSGNQVVGTATGGAGQDAFVQCVAVAAGTYTITVTGAGGSTGPYSITATLNAALEAEYHGGPSNNTLATAQNIDSSFIPLGAGSGATRGAVLGSTTAYGGPSTIFSADFENGTQGFTINNTGGGLWHWSTGRGSQSGHSATHSLYYGQGEGASGGGNYNTGAHNTGSITSPSIALPAGTDPKVDFNYVLQTENTAGYDLANLQISTDGGTTFTALAPYNVVAESAVWKDSAPVDLGAYAGKSIKLRWLFDTIDNFNNTYEGWYVDDVRIVAAAPAVDDYAFTLNAGDSITAALKALTGQSGAIALTILGPDGSPLANGATSATNVPDGVVSDLVASVSGTYYAQITGPSGSDYALLITHNADFKTQPNNTLPTAQRVLSTPVGAPVTQVVLGHMDSPTSVDDFAVTLAAGATLVLSTSTPGDGPNEPANLLNPRLRVLNASGMQVALDDNSAPDGRNASLSFMAPSAGTYYVEVSSSLAAPTTGDYVLSISGVNTTPAAFTVVSTTPAAGANLNVTPTTATVTFSGSVLLSSLQASDLTLDGVPASAVSAVGNSSTTFSFTLPGGIAQGSHTLAIAAGAVSNLQGGPVSAYSAQFTLDTIPPRVISSSVAEGASLAPGSLTYTVGFSEPMLKANVIAAAFSLKGVLRNVAYSPLSFIFNTSGTMLTIIYASLPEDNYTLTLNSVGGVGGVFEDAAGNFLDGEPVWPMPPNVSGNGIAGGDFFVDFSMDIGSTPYPTPLTPLNPPGSLIYDPIASGLINNASDTDSFTLNLDAGQTVSVAAHPIAVGLQPTVTVFGPGNVVLGSGTAPAPGGEALLQTITVATAGTYTFAVGSAGGTVGQYTLQLVLNAALDAENHGRAPNDTPGSAQNIDSSFISLGGAAQRGAVLGATDPSAGLLPAEVEPNDTLASANNASANFFGFSSNLYHLGLSGTLTSGSDTDWYKLGAMQVGDVLTISESGSPSSRGTLADSYLELYRAGSSSPVTFDDDNGPGTDSLIYRFTVSAADTYYVHATGFGGSFSGSYQLGVYLENASTTPTTGGTVTTETDPNNTEATATDASTSWRAVQYRSETTGSITAVDVDFYSYKFTAGDLVTINIKPTGSAWTPKVSLMNASGTVIALEDGTSITNGGGSPLYGFIIPSTGTYFVQVQGASGIGTYTSDIYLSTNTPPATANTDGDYFSLTLAAGQSLTVAATALAAGNLNLTLVDAGGNVLATGAAGATNVSQLISDYLAPAAGTYYVRVGGDAGLSYTIVATRGADFDSEPNNTLASAQSINQTHTVLGSISGTDDYYSFSAAAGATITLATTTPGDGPGEFRNTLNPRLDLYDPNNALVASDDNSAPDGRNALLSYVVPAGGIYKIHIAAGSGTSGEYVLTVTSATAAPPVVAAFTLPAGVEGTATTPVNGSFTGQAGDSFTATVDYGEGAGPQALALTGNTFTLTHAYIEGGTYPVSVMVTDTTAHLTSAASSANVTISDAQVQATITGAPATTSVGGSINLNFVATNPDLLEMGPLIESWTITDASNTIVASGTGGPFTFTPAAAGVYTVNFSAGESTVADAETGTATATITVNPAPAYVGTQIDDGNRQRSVVRSLTFKFSSAVTLSAGAITLARMNTAGSNSGTNDGAPPTDASAALDFAHATTPDGGLTWVVPFVKSVAGFTDGSGSLVDNVYAAT
ncbi:MAG: hypothetical protein JWN24_3935, partial [Phycisphaerales bacterium]|nr:hypothetical protein [Phycisphaerales bacterium]